MEVCRACLTTEKDMVPIDTIILSNYNILTNLNLVITDELPLYSCNTCLDAITFCTEFRQKCISSDLAFQEILFSTDKIKCETTSDNVIETEYKLEPEWEWKDHYYNEPSSNDNDSSNYTIKTENDNDYVPQKSLKPSKKKVKLKKKLQKNKLSTKVKVEKDNKLQFCGICSETLDNTDKFLKHIECHKLDKTCGLCMQQFIDFTHLLAHRLIHLPQAQKMCHICSRKFGSPNALEFHYVKKHNLRGEDGQVVCKICLIPYLTPRKINQHFQTVHSNIKYICSKCDKGFRVKQSLKSHMKIHTDQKTYECDLCDYTCKHRGNLREHKLRKHTEGRVYCKTCGTAFPGQDILDKHMCKRARGFICPCCGKQVTNLRRHKLSHNSEPRFKCDRCPSTFKSSSSYKAHMNKHNGTKPFQCQYCSMSFYSQPVLIKHRRTHTGEKPYVCKICSKAFTGNNNLKVHMKVHGEHLVVKKTTEPKVNIIQ